MIAQGTIQQLATMADAVDGAVSAATRGYFTGADVDAARAAMSSFWSLQMQVQPNAEGDQNATINALNARVHAAWGRLETFLSSADPDTSTWATHAANAQTAFADAASLGQSAGQSTRQVESYGVQAQNAAGAPKWGASTYLDTSFGGAIDRQFGTRTDSATDPYAWLPKVESTLTQSFLGLPVWAWGLVALGGVFLLTRRGN